MARVRPDFSFDREGRPLSAWLLDLVSDDAPTRLKAGDVLQGMSFGVPYAHTELDDLDWEEHGSRPGQGERFAAAVRDAVAAPGFLTADFVRSLILFRMTLHEDWRRRAETSRRRSDEEPDRFVERIVRRLESAGDDVERAAAARRLQRWFCARIERDFEADRAIFEGAEEMSPAGYASHLVFNALDVALLTDRPGLRLMLDDEPIHRSEALEALRRIGPPAVDFAPGLLARVDSSEDDRFDAARALGSIGRDEPEVIDALLARLASPDREVRQSAAACLAWAGPPLAGRVDDAVRLLMEATRPPGVDAGSIEALATLGRDRETALARLLDLASPKEPRRVVDRRADYDERFDEAMQHRGAAIDALRHFRTFADRVIPTLIRAIDTFEEYDPDESYGGDHARVCRTIAAFGPAAAPAVPRLVAYLESWRTRPEDGGSSSPSAIFDALKAMGRAAVRALPILEAIRSDADESDDPQLDATILAIRGG